MDSEAGGTMEVAALGRPFSLGMLYDCRKDSLVPGITLWDRNDLEKDKGERPKPNTDFEIVASESIEDKSSALNVEASLKASFLSGLVEVDGSAKYLNDSKISKNQARVTLKYKATTKFQELSMDHLGRENMKHSYVFGKGLATHVVTAILYGAQAFFVFDREVSKKEDHQDIEGNLKVMIKKFPSLAIEGEGSLKLEDKDRANVEKFSCRFFGDFALEKSPVSFQDAVEVYQSLPRLLGANGEKAVPMKVWLLPLTSLDSSAAKLVRQISIGLVQESQRVLEDFSELEMRCNDTMRTTTAQQFPQIGKKIKSFKEMCSEFKLGFQQNLAKKLPSIRGGGEEEAVLAEILKKRHSSPFNSKDLNEWLDCKEREVYTLMSLTNMMKNTKIVPSQNVLSEETLSAEHAVCFVFTSLGSAEPYLSALSNYLKQTPEADDPQDVEKEQWFTSKEITDAMRNKAKLFSDFAEANKENKNIKFLTVGLTNETQKGSSIYLYEDGFSVNENFEPPSKPETVTASDIKHNSVTLKISAPRFGAENITSYSVEYCVRGEDGWQQETASKAGEVTVSHLSPNTEYMFRCRAVTSAGVGPANEASGSIKTLPCSPPGELQVEPNSSEISVSWEKPAELGQDVQILSYIVEYAKTDNGVKEEDLQWKQMMSRAEKAIISGLQPETEYVVRVRCDCGKAGRSKESISVNVCTTTFTGESVRCSRLEVRGAVTDNLDRRMESEAGGTMEVAALGRPFNLGMLYDCRRDSLVPGITLWDHDDLIKYVQERPQNYNDFEIVASESIEDKSSALNVEASLKASFLSGLVEVDGSAKYLNDSKISKNQARVTLKYKATTKFQELSMDHLGRDNMKHSYVFDKGLATHVVTAILYGAQAFFVFDREVSKKEDHQDIEGNLKVMIKKIPCLAIEGEGSLKLEDKDRANVEKFSCRFFGDFSLEKSPVSFQDAVEVYQSLPRLLGANGEKAVPMKVWLLPLTSLDSSAAKLVRQISIGLVQESQRVLEDFSELEMRCNDTMRTTTAQQFPQIGKKIKSFKEMCSEFKLEFQRTLSKKLPSIRGGGEEEAVLAEILKKRHSSPFNSKDLNEWMDCKEREVYTLMSLTNKMKNTKIIPSQTDLYREILSADHAMCFVFTSLGSAEPYLSALSNYIKQTPEADDPQDVEKEQWFTSKEITDAMRNKAKLFSDFAEANKENKNIKFLTVGLTNETQKGSSIYLYEDGFSVNENFEPPSKPETVTASDIKHNSVTLKISAPRFGAENITSYSVEYCVRGEDGWQQETASKAGEVTVSHLSPNTEYMFRCRAVTSAGVGPANEASGSIKTC
ncbi:uncharacterized protein LOC119902689 isoform X1 [Micropterus salmoides]|uniref:uncharacterized protein LOC119902689 isoform X1 n=1 Tax=Micropterus salmoides TaxID=27706 RepID=UPI0018ECD15B|nr:uncharacterized protein LOC119902689 isoform X1 [Micropterus salmoides]XP_038574945.1 uncharacterized protein LOC119902689 isoform X1 [Micropterus salmoides]XP_038574947.1 uncharacterized protein LOC119902689 isoform X1 [Micropterus salmoides]